MLRQICVYYHRHKKNRFDRRQGGCIFWQGMQNGGMGQIGRQWSAVWIVILLSVLFTLTACHKPPAWKSQPQIIAALQQVQISINNKQWQLASSQLDRVKTQVPACKYNSIYWSYRAQVASRLGFLHRATTAGAKALQLAPQSGLVANNDLVLLCLAAQAESNPALAATYRKQAKIVFIQALQMSTLSHISRLQLLANAKRCGMDG